MISRLFKVSKNALSSFEKLGHVSYQGGAGEHFSRPIALAIRVLVGFKREYRRDGISYRFAVMGVPAHFCHTYKLILRFLIL